MNTDIRLSVLFLDHPKTIKLRRRLGFAGVESLIRLWCWTAQNKPDGDLLCMDADDIEIAARWEGEGGAFIGELVSLRWLDRGESSGYRLHDWQVHNPWAANAEDRGNKARLSRLARVDKDLYSTAVTEGKTGLTRIEYESLTNRKRISNDPVTPAPAPAPAPAPKTHKDTSATPPCACPHLEIIKEYNSILPILPSVKPKLWNGTRKANLINRWKEDPERQRVEWWREYFNMVKSSPFLTGIKTEWKADLGWLVKADNMVKVLEGKYNNAKPKGTTIGGYEFESR